MFTILLTISSVTIGSLLLRTIYVIRQYKFNDLPVGAGDKPSVSVCIAARNETHALARCLERVLKSDYPKLEILVLDDSSTDDTPLIVKSFASAGVRFIPGKPLPAGWLGKNHAYQTLITEASGDIVLFLDVDTTIGQNTISALISCMSAKKLAMLSVLPKRTDIEHASAVLGTFRYTWEMLLGTKASPPGASALWAVRAETLRTNGVGLENYSMSVRPERHLARQLQRVSDYRYIISSTKLRVGFEKRLISQWETATRLYYPMVGRNILAWLVALAYLGSLLIPFVVLALWPRTFDFINWATWLIVALSFTLFLLLKATHGPTIWRLKMLIWPLLLIQEVVLMVRSFVQYQTGKVEWKGRSVSAQPYNHTDLRIDE